MGPPSGGPASEAFKGGGSRGDCEKRSVKDLQEGLDTFLGGTCFGEASADYLLGCTKTKKVWSSPLSVEKTAPTSFYAICRIPLAGQSREPILSPGMVLVSSAPQAVAVAASLAPRPPRRTWGQRPKIAFQPRRGGANGQIFTRTAFRRSHRLPMEVPSLRGRQLSSCIFSLELALFRL